MGDIMQSGLIETEVIINRKKYGENKLTKKREDTFLKLLLESLGDPIIKILLIALALKTLFLFKNFDWYETIGIVLAIFLASFISTISEYGSNQAFKRLQAESKRIKCRVRRDNKIKEILIEEVVVNDIVLLSSGDSIPADGIIINGSIIIDDSALTGETKEKNKNENNNDVFRGMNVIKGYAEVLIKKVGDMTTYGILSLEVQEKEIESPLKLKLINLAKIISKIGYIGAFLVSIAYLFSVIVLKNNFDYNQIIATITNFPLITSYLLHALTLSVTVIVVAVPEGLPMMIALVLSSNIKKMVKNNVLVRKMVGIETAGNINILFSDKTGTITKGELEVIGIVDYNNNKYDSLVDLKRHSSYYNYIELSLVYNNEGSYVNNQVIGGNWTDKALLNFIKVEAIKNKNIEYHVPFDSQNKYSSIVVDKVKYIKGSPEKLIKLCTKTIDQNGNTIPLLNKKAIEEKINIWTSLGIRVIILTMTKNINSIDNLTFIGTVLIKDEIRKEVREAIQLTKKAGISTIMITGDNKETAVSIAKEIDLITSTKDLVLTSDEISYMSDAELKEKIFNIKVIARSLPQDKSRLVKISQELNLVVGMTGDGVNDAPALKKADVGFAMGSGTEVAKEASNIIILDNNFLSIVKSILFGRTIFKSIRKFVLFQLTINACAIIISLVCPFIGIPEPITVIQMLWINMIMDTLAGIAFSYEPPLLEYMEENPKKRTDNIINKYMLNSIIIIGLYSSIICIAFLKGPIIEGIYRNNDYKMTAFFCLFIFLSIFNSFNARTHRLNILAHIRKNKIFLIILLFIIIVQLYLIYYGGSLFRTFGLSLKEIIIVILTSLSVIPIDFIRKKIYKRNNIEMGV